MPDNREDDIVEEPDFTVVKLVKFDSRPARWSVTVRAPGDRELTATVETVNLVTFRLFQAYFFEQTNCMLSDVTQRRWKLMLAGAEVETKEATDALFEKHRIEKSLDEFLSEARDNPDLGMLSSFAGWDENGRYFRLQAYLDFIKDQDLKVEDQAVFEHLKRLGFKNQVRRFGMKLQRVWVEPENKKLV